MHQYIDLEIQKEFSETLNKSEWRAALQDVFGNREEDMKDSKELVFVNLMLQEIKAHIEKEQALAAQDVNAKASYDEMAINTVKFVLIKQAMDALLSCLKDKSAAEITIIQNNALSLIKRTINLYPEFKHLLAAYVDENGMSLLLLAANKELLVFVELFVAIGCDLDLRSNETAADIGVRKDFPPQLLAKLLTRANSDATQHKIYAPCASLQKYCADYEIVFTSDKAMSAITSLIKHANLVHAIALREYKQGQQAYSIQDQGFLRFSALPQNIASDAQEIQAKEAVNKFFKTMFMLNYEVDPDGITNNIKLIVDIFEDLIDSNKVEHLSAIFGNSYLAEEILFWFNSDAFIPPQIEALEEDSLEEDEENVDNVLSKRTSSDERNRPYM